MVAIQPRGSPKNNLEKDVILRFKTECKKNRASDVGNVAYLLRHSFSIIRVFKSALDGPNLTSSLLEHFQVANKTLSNFKLQSNITRENSMKLDIPVSL